MVKIKQINEVFWLRSIACLAVTFGHALKTGYKNGSLATNNDVIAYVLYIGILFGVPVFVFISELLLANKYSNKIPSNFIKKRLKLLVIPYIFMNTVYAIISTTVWNLKEIGINILRNIFLGESTIYFILIIFQFYFLHILFSKFLERLSPKKVLPIAFIINLLYLSFFNFIKPPLNNPILHYIWDPGYWMPFVGWIFYFVLGYYCGKNYDTFIQLIQKFKIWVLCMPFISFIIIIEMNKFFLITQNSKRFDMLIFATAMIFFITYLSTNIKSTPKIILQISNYSFSIFLLNQFYFILFLTIKVPQQMNILTYSIITFILSILCSCSTSYIINQFPFGKYMVGQIKNLNTRKNNQRTYPSINS